MPLVCRPASLGAIALVGALAAGLSGCTTPSPKPTVSVEPTAEAPIFANDEEALAAAEAAYAAYVAADAKVSQAGGVGADALRELVAEPYIDEILDNFESMMEHGYRTTGAVSADRFRLVQHDSTSDPETVQVYLCASAGDTRLFDAAGTDITPPDRPAAVPLVVSFEAHDGALRLSGSEYWTGDDFCV